jgi:acyl-CoA thioester hydrolase
MIITETKIRVYYEDTDQMGVVYYGNYARYYEIGRTEMIRDLGFTYKQLEEMNIMLPARSLKINFLKPAYYDDLLTIRTIVDSIPAVKFPIKTEIYNEKGVLINSGEVVLVFMNALTNKPVAAPKFFSEELTKIFRKNDELSGKE